MVDKRLVITIVNYKGYKEANCLEDLVGERLSGLIDSDNLIADNIKVEVEGEVLSGD